MTRAREGDIPPSPPPPEQVEYWCPRGTSVESRWEGAWYEMRKWYNVQIYTLPLLSGQRNKIQFLSNKITHCIIIYNRKLPFFLCFAARRSAERSAAILQLPCSSSWPCCHQLLYLLLHRSWPGQHSVSPATVSLAGRWLHSAQEADLRAPVREAQTSVLARMRTGSMARTAAGWARWYGRGQSIAIKKQLHWFILSFATQLFVWCIFFYLFRGSTKLNMLAPILQEARKDKDVHLRCR